MPFIATLKDFDETAGDLDLPPLSSDFAPRDGDPIPESDASNPKEAAGALKTPFRHMPVGVLYEDAAVFALGAQKYGTSTGATPMSGALCTTRPRSGICSPGSRARPTTPSPVSRIWRTCGRTARS